MKSFLAVMVVLAGAGTVVQTAMNAQLRVSLGHGLLSAGANFVVGLVALATLLLCLRVPPPSLAEISSIPLWAWFGGVLGALFVGVLAFSGRDLGAVVVVALIVTGQMLASLVFDHFGWLGFRVQPISLSRVLGCVLLLVSLLLFRRG